MRNKKEHTKNPFDDSELKVSYDCFIRISKLSKTSIKVFMYIREDCFKRDGVLYFDKKAAKESCEFKEYKSIYNALSQLIDLGILAGKQNSDEFYYNPKFINEKKELYDT